jgi:hypothetical protein
MYGGRGFLNQFLVDELQTVCPAGEAFYFDNIPDAIKHFAEITGVKAEVLSPEQIDRIKREEETLPPQRDFIMNDITWTSWNTEQQRRFNAMHSNVGVQYFFPPELRGGGVSGDPGISGDLGISGNPGVSGHSPTEPKE